MIYTPFHFSSMHIHVDYRSQPTTEFDTIGGSAGPDTDSEGYPQVTPQQSYLLVLVYGIDARAQAESKTVMIVVDAFPIDAKGIVTLQPGSVEQGNVYPAKTARRGNSRIRATSNAGPVLPLYTSTFSCCT